MNAATELVIFFGLLTVVIAYNLLLIYLFRLLKKDHTEIWEKLGRSPFRRNYSLSNFLNLLRFIWLRESFLLNNARIRTISIVIMALQVLGLSVFIFLCAFVVPANLEWWRR